MQYLRWPLGENSHGPRQEMEMRESIHTQTLMFRLQSPTSGIPHLGLLLSSKFIFRVLSISLSLCLFSLTSPFLVLHPAPRQEAGFLSPTRSPASPLPTNLPHLSCHAVGPLLLFQLNNNFQCWFFNFFFCFFFFYPFTKSAVEMNISLTGWVTSRLCLGW